MLTLPNTILNIGSKALAFGGQNPEASQLGKLTTPWPDGSGRLDSQLGRTVSGHSNLTGVPLSVTLTSGAGSARDRMIGSWIFRADNVWNATIGPKIVYPNSGIYDSGGLERVEFQGAIINTGAMFGTRLYNIREIIWPRSGGGGLGQWSFHILNYIKTIRVPEGVESMATDVMTHMRELEEIWLPSTLVEINDTSNAPNFYNLPALKRVYITYASSARKTEMEAMFGDRLTSQARLQSRDGLPTVRWVEKSVAQQ